MKSIFVLFGVLLLSFLVTEAQPPRRHLTPRDTSRMAFEAGRAQCINAPILRGNSQGATIVPVRQQFCFDLEMDVALNFGGRISRETTLFINTTDGYMGYTTPSAGGPISDLMPEVEDFRFTVMSFKLGNIFTYFNRKENNNIMEHLVTTSNTDAHEYQASNLLTAAPLSRKSEYRNYCDGKARALAYKRDDGPTTWYIYGDRYPATLQVQKFLGGFGVGVIKTDAGIFMVMELGLGRNYTVIKHIERRTVCFNPEAFKLQEADFFAKRSADLQQEQVKINADEAEAQHAPCCIAERMAQINFRREQLRVQQDNARKAQQGNLIQDRVAQKGMMDTMDPLPMVQGSILATRTSICTARFYMSRDPARGGQKISCLNGQLSALQIAENQMRAVDRQYSTDIARALVEKSRIYSGLMRQPSCN